MSHVFAVECGVHERVANKILFNPFVFPCEDSLVESVTSVKRVVRTPSRGILFAMFGPRRAVLGGRAFAFDPQVLTS